MIKKKPGYEVWIIVKTSGNKWGKSSLITPSLFIMCYVITNHQISHCEGEKTSVFITIRELNKNLK